MAAKENYSIKFSHPYAKLPKAWENGRALLLAVFPSRFEDLKVDFKNYDTVYFEKGIGYYPLPKKGDCLVLLFLSLDVIFTTVRRSTPSKKKYYEGAVGKFFKLERG